MVLNKLQKKDLLNWIIKTLKDNKSTMFVQLTGINVNDVTELRSKLRECNVGCKVIKNTLLEKAIDEMKMSIDGAIIGKTVGLVYSQTDEVEPSKIVYEFGKTHEMVKLLGGVVNANYMDQNAVIALAKLPGREELYARVVGSLASPLSGMVNVLAGNLRGLVSVLKQYQEKKVQ